MNVGLLQAERYFRAVVRETRNGFQRTSEDRARRTKQMLEAVERLRVHEDQATAKNKEELKQIKGLLAQLIAQLGKPSQRSVPDRDLE
jgi:hypothetical protein